MVRPNSGSMILDNPMAVNVFDIVMQQFWIDCAFGQTNDIVI
jgi:hypothetical protein